MLRWGSWVNKTLTKMLRSGFVFFLASSSSFRWSDHERPMLHFFFLSSSFLFHLQIRCTVGFWIAETVRFPSFGSNSTISVIWPSILAMRRFSQRYVSLDNWIDSYCAILIVNYTISITMVYSTLLDPTL